MIDFAAHRRLRITIQKLAIDPDAKDLSNAIDAFGQVIADLIEKPCAFSVIIEGALDELTQLRIENARLKNEIRLLALDGGTVQ